MDYDLPQRIMRHDGLLQKLLVTNSPVDSIKCRLNIMEDLVMKIPRELTDLTNYWYNRMALHWTVYASLLLLPPIRAPSRQVGSVCDTAQILAKSNVQPKKAVTFAKLPYCPQRPERAQQAESNVQDSRADTLKSILKPTARGHSSYCNDTDANQYVKSKEHTSLDGRKSQCTASSSARTIGHDPSKQTSKFVATPTIPVTTSTQNGQHNSFVQRPLKRTQQTMNESIVPSSSSLQQPPKRSRVCKRALQSELMAFFSATAHVRDDDDIQGLKGLLRTVYKVIGHLKDSFLWHDQELQLQLLQQAFDKLNENSRVHYLTQNSQRAINNLGHFKYFVKGQICLFMSKYTSKVIAQANKSSNKRIYCSYCKQCTNHSIANCPVREIIKPTLICFECLEDGHHQDHCPKMK